MPFTPLHMGPGLAIKAVAGRRFSVLTFAMAQVAMDIEPLFAMIRGSSARHGRTHTFLAALFIAAIVSIVAPPICRTILRWWNHELCSYHLRWLTAPDPRSAAPVVVGAFVGTMSHVTLDSIMYADMTPLAPWTNSNGLLGVVSITTLHYVGIGSGIVGILVWLALGWPRGGARRGS